MDSTTQDSIATTFSITGIFAYLMDFQAEITLLVLLTSLALNLGRIITVFTKKKK